MRAWRRDDAREAAAVGRLVGDYLVATEGEKGAPVTRASSLPERYRREAADPVAAFAGASVLVAVDGADVPVGCAILGPARQRRGELKRVWVDPAHRGQGLAGALVDAAIAEARECGDVALRLTVWDWREGAVALYRRRGFVDAEPWDARPRLLCLERAIDPRTRSR